MREDEYPSINETLDRLDYEPILFLGMTQTEFFVAAGVGAAVLIPASIIILMLFGQGLVGIGLGMLLDFVWVMYAGRWLSRQKETKPDVMVWISLEKWVQQHLGFGKSHIVDDTPFCMSLPEPRKAVLWEKRQNKVDEE